MLGKRRTGLLLTLLLASPVKWAVAQEATELPELPKAQLLSCGNQCSNFNDAKAKDHKLPTFPRSMDGLNPYAEGYVELQYMIGADGKTHDISQVYVLGPQGFADATIDAVKAWTFEPATLNGKPVEQSRGLRLTYGATAVNPGARVNVDEIYKEIVANSGNLEAVRGKLEAAFARPEIAFNERNTLAPPLSELAVQHKDYFQARRLAVMGSTFVNPQFPGLARIALRVRVTVGMYLGEVIDAMNAADGLAKLRGVTPETETLAFARNTREKLDALPHIVVQAMIPDDPESKIYVHSLYRRTFSFQPVSGLPERFLLGCDGNTIKSKIAAETQWQIPKSWGGCFLYVYGVPGTKFNLIETRDEPRQGPPVMTSFDAAIAANPGSAAAYLARAKAYQDHKMLNEALADYGKAAELDPKMMEIYSNRSRLLYNRGEFAAALVDADKVIALENKDNFVGYSQRGFNLREMGKYDEALGDLTVLTDKKLDAGYFGRAITLFCLERYVDAEFDIRNFLARHPRDLGAKIWLHIIMTRRGMDGPANFFAGTTSMQNPAWLEHVGGLYAGRETLAAVEAQLAAAPPDEEASNYWPCWAKFYLGEYKLEHGDLAGARADFAQIPPAGCPHAESSAAAASLKRLMAGRGP